MGRGGFIFNLKVRQDLFRAELWMAVGVFMSLWVGMAISLGGLRQLPKCRYGDEDCYFYVQLCGNSIMPLNRTWDDVNNIRSPSQSKFLSQSTFQCMWLPKQRRIQGSSENNSEQLIVPTLASILGVLPGIALIFACTVRNERSVFFSIEFAKMFLGFDILMLVVACMKLDQLTWDCRWWNKNHQPDHDACESAYGKYVIGTSFLFTTQVILMGFSVIFSEQERKRVSQKVLNVSNTDSVTMNTRTNAAVGWAD